MRTLLYIPPPVFLSQINSVRLLFRCSTRIGKNKIQCVEKPFWEFEKSNTVQYILIWCGNILVNALASLFHLSCMITERPNSNLNSFDSALLAMKQDKNLFDIHSNKQSLRITNPHHAS